VYVYVCVCVCVCMCMCVCVCLCMYGRVRLCVFEVVCSNTLCPCIRIKSAILCSTSVCVGGGGHCNYLSGKGLCPSCRVVAKSLEPVSKGTGFCSQQTQVMIV